MKKLVLSTLLVVSTTTLTKDFDDFKDFQTVQRAWGYSGIEIGVNYKNIGTNYDSKGLLEDRYSEIKSELEDIKNYLDKSSYDRDMIFNLTYRKINTENYSFNQGELIIGKIIDDEGISGVKIIYGDGKSEYKNEKDDLEKVGGQLFYRYKGLENSFSLIGYLNSVKAKDEKLQDIGANFNFKHSFNNYYFDTFDPATYIDINFVSVDHRTKDKERNLSTTAEIGTEFKNEIERDNVKMTSNLKVGYEREFFEEKNYKSLKYKNKDVDGAIAKVGVNINYMDVVEFTMDGKIRKSLNKNNLETVGSVGLKIAF